MITRYCTDIGYRSLKKHGELLCGDNVEVVEPDENSTVMVLADGLGSGVKANILSTLTSKILSTMMAQSMTLEECVSAVVETLPVCEVRRLAYSTFTIIKISNDFDAEVIQYDNPRAILIRDGKRLDYDMTLQKIDDKEIYKSKVKLQENDTFIAVSDGVVHAGVGKRLDFGWEWENVARFMERTYRREHTAKTLTSILLEECSMLYDDQPGDDTTVCTMKIRRRKPMNLMIGPPANPRDVEKMMRTFFAARGKHIVCGGTTSTLAAGFLGKKVEVPLSGYVDSEIPPIAKIQGVDLATEGVITINKVLSYSKDYVTDNRLYMDWIRREDGASMVAKLLFEDATDIHFYVGKAVNPAHQNPDLPIGFSIKMRLIEELAECLKKMGKRVAVDYF